MNKTDRRILATASVLVAMMLYLLYDDSILLPSDENGSLTAIGNISQTDHDVRRKITRQFMWRTARSKDTIHLGDSVFTGEGSAAQVVLKDGRKLTLQENSLIVFSGKGDQLNLDLQFGKIAGNIDGCVKISIKGQAKDVCGKNGVVEVDSEGTVKTETAPKELISWVQAPPTHFFHYKNQAPLKVSWKVEQAFGRYHFQLSRQKDFKKISYELKTQSQFISTRGYPAKGEYFARIQADDIKGEAAAYSQVQKMEIHEANLPVITAPLAQAKFTVKTNVDGELLQSDQVSIQWKYSIPGSHFDLELARDKDFTDVVIKKNDIIASSLQTDRLATGQYFVRVRDAAITDEARRPWSAPVSFAMDIQKPPRLATPELLTEKINYMAPSKEVPVLEWDEVENASKYTVEIASNPNFENAKIYTTNQTKLVLKDLTPGSSYFRVTAETAKGTRSEASSAGDLRIQVKKPLLNPAENPLVQAKTPEDQGDPQSLKVSWTDLQLVDSYVVELAEDPEFKTKKEYYSTVPQAEIVLPHPGDYHWRVRGQSKTGQPLTPYSDPGQMKYSLKVPLATPELIEPYDQITLFFQQNESPYVWFEWKPVRQAANYTLEVATDPEFSQKILTITTKKTRHLLKDHLPATTLYWRVQAQGEDQKTSFWPTPRQMTVFMGRSPAGRTPSGKHR